MLSVYSRELLACSKSVLLAPCCCLAKVKVGKKKETNKRSMEESETRAMPAKEEKLFTSSSSTIQNVHQMSNSMPAFIAECF